MRKTFLLAFLLLSWGKVSAQDVTPLEVNLEELVEQAVLGEIAPPRMSESPYRVSPKGELLVLPGSGTITYNRRVGDSAVQMAGDHVEPAVSLWNSEGRDSAESRALNILSCIGNRARVVTGDAKGQIGTVIGKHGGAEHIMVEFPDQVYDQLVIGDKVQIRAIGQGMEARNVEDVSIQNVSPDLLEALTDAGLGVSPDGRLRAPVALRVPAKIMGSGLGRRQTYSGDYDIQMFDEETVAEYGLDRIRYGDIVALINADSLHGRIYRTGAVTIGVVVHGISSGAGHGPGVVTLFTSPSGNIEPVERPDMNLASLLNLR